MAWSQTRFRPPSMGGVEQGPLGLRDALCEVAWPCSEQQSSVATGLARHVHGQVFNGASVRRAVYHRRRRPVLSDYRGGAVGAWSVSLAVLAPGWRRVARVLADPDAPAARPLARSQAEAQQA
eukprot:scaffold7340_cov266-Pinguiococcus_pyrenoidosus.AAC.64